MNAMPPAQKSLTEMMAEMRLTIHRLTSRVAMLEARPAVTVAPVQIQPPPVIVARHSMAVLCAAVEKAHGVTTDEMMAKHGRRELVDARAEFCKLAHGAGFSLSRIGGFLGGRDHTSVLYLCRRADRSAAVAQ